MLNQSAKKSSKLDSSVSKTKSFRYSLLRASLWYFFQRSFVSQKHFQNNVFFITNQSPFSESSFYCFSGYYIPRPFHLSCYFGKRCFFKILSFHELIIPLDNQFFHFPWILILKEQLTERSKGCSFYVRPPEMPPAKLIFLFQT